MPHKKAFKLWKAVSTILDINYVDFLQFQWDFIPHAELEEAFIYIIHKLIDFSYRLKTFHVDLRLKTFRIDLILRILDHMVIGLRQVKVPIGT